MMMTKKMLFLALLMCFSVNSFSKTVNDNASVTFQFYVNGDIPNVENDFEEDHFLGEPVTAKWNTFIKNYTHDYSVSVGLSDNGVEILKPAVFNAVKKANKYIRKAVKGNIMSHEKAVAEMTHILDCANVIIMEPDTKQFEQIISDVKDGNEIVAVFDKVKLIWN